MKLIIATTYYWRRLEHGTAFAAWVDNAVTDNALRLRTPDGRGHELHGFGSPLAVDSPTLSARGTPWARTASRSSALFAHAPSTFERSAPRRMVWRQGQEQRETGLTFGIVVHGGSDDS